MCDRLFGSSALVGQDAESARQRERENSSLQQVGGTGTRWHGMKARYRPLFAQPELVEDWYNRLAPPKLKDAFRGVMKLLLLVPAERIGIAANKGVVDPAEWHRANHVLRLYGDVFTAGTHDRIVGFLCHCSRAEAGTFGDVVNSIQSMMPVKTATKSAWVPLDRLAEQPDRERFHKVVDWISLTAAEKVRRGYANPMDTKRFGVQQAQASGKEQADSVLAHVPAQLRMGQKKTIGAVQALIEAAAQSARTGTAAEAALSEIGHVAAQLVKSRKSHLELTGGRYEVDPATGVTLFQVKGQATSTALNKPGQQSMRERIVTAAGVPSHSWKSTTKDHFPNLSHGLGDDHGRVNPELHPCVARVTAATCMCVPSLKPKVDQAVPTRGLRL